MSHLLHNRLHLSHKDISSKYRNVCLITRKPNKISQAAQNYPEQFHYHTSTSRCFWCLKDDMLMHTHFSYVLFLIFNFSIVVTDDDFIVCGWWKLSSHKRRRKSELKNSLSCVNEHHISFVSFILCTLHINTTAATKGHENKFVCRVCKWLWFCKRSAILFKGKWLLNFKINKFTLRKNWFNFNSKFQLIAIDDPKCSYT